MKQKEKYLSDVMIWVADCLKEVDGIDIEWRVLHKYAEDYLEDNQLEIEVRDKI